MLAEEVVSIIGLRGLPLRSVTFLDIARFLDFLRIKDYSGALANVWEWALVVTNLRCIFAQITNQMIKEELNRRKTKAKEEGKGFFGQWKAAHPTDLCEYIHKYMKMEPDGILQETSGNYSIANSDIDSIEVVTTTIRHQKDSGVIYPSRKAPPVVELVIDSRAGRNTYLVNDYYLTRKVEGKRESYFPKDLELLRMVFGQKVRISEKTVDIMLTYD